MGAYIVHNVTVTGSRWKAVTCRSCRADFAYLRSAEAQGDAATGWWNFGKNQGAAAEKKATSKLARELDGNSPVRCPGCDRFQPEMFSAIRGRWFARYAWMPIAGALLALVLVGLFGRRDALTLSPGDFIESFLENIFNLDTWLAVIAAAALAGFGALWLAAGNIDPNDKPDLWSTMRGWTRSDYERSRLQDASKPALEWSRDSGNALTPGPINIAVPAPALDRAHSQRPRA